MGIPSKVDVRKFNRRCKSIFSLEDRHVQPLLDALYWAWHNRPRKCLMGWKILATWFRWPMVGSRVLCLTLDADNRSVISDDQFRYLSFGREISNDLVFRIQPRIVFVSSILLSAANFFTEMMSFQGGFSFGFIGRARAWITNGIEWLTLVTFSLMSGAIAIVSSIYMSTFPKSFSGILTDNGWAWWKGM